MVRFIETQTLLLHLNVRLQGLLLQFWTRKF
jgi:hypothetical protein